MGRKNRRLQTRYRPVKFWRIPHLTKSSCVPKRGQIWYAYLGNNIRTYVQSGERPVLIISNNIANEHAGVVTVLPMTTRIKKLNLPTHVPIGCGVYGNANSSMVMAEQITTLDKSALSNPIGVMPREKMTVIEDAVKALLAMQ